MRNNDREMMAASLSLRIWLNNRPDVTCIVAVFLIIVTAVCPVYELGSLKQKYSI